MIAIVYPLMMYNNDFLTPSIIMIISSQSIEYHDSKAKWLDYATPVLIWAPDCQIVPKCDLRLDKTQ